MELAHATQPCGERLIGPKLSGSVIQDLRLEGVAHDLGFGVKGLGFSLGFASVSLLQWHFKIARQKKLELHNLCIRSYGNMRAKVIPNIAVSEYPFNTANLKP